MEYLTAGLGEALSQLNDPRLLLFFALGTLNGMVFGLLPGLSGSVGIALMIPLTYSLSLNEAMTLFVAALSGQTFAGSIGAILLNMPGTSPNAATTFDGYPLTQQGRGGFAIGVSAMASALGSVIGVLVLIALLPAVRATILAFGYPEFTMLGILGITAIAMASRGTLLKGLASGALGIILSFVGFAPIGNQLRYTFDQLWLWEGVNLIPILIGMFAVAEVMRLVIKRRAVTEAKLSAKIGRAQVFEGMGFVLKNPGLLVRSAMLGTGLGIIPGVGGTVASFLAYFQAQKTSKDGKFGEGDPRGVLAPEAANDAKDAGAALPTLGFGLPGSSDWAIILGAMILHGVAPGPNLMREAPDVIWIVIFIILAASFATSAAGVAAAPLLTKLSQVRGSVIGPIVVSFAIMGSFALGERNTDVYLAIAGAVLGFYFARNSIPVVPLILGLILGSQVESWYVRTGVLYDGGLLVFVTRPISAVLTLGILALLLSEVRQARRRRSARGDLGQAVTPRLSGVILFAVLAVVAIVTIVQAPSFTEPTNVFPMIIGVALLTFAVAYLAIVLAPGLRRRYWTFVGEDAFVQRTSSVEATVGGHASGAGSGNDHAEVASGADDVTLPRAEERRRELFVMASFIGLALLLSLIGPALSLPLFMVLLMWVLGRESVKLTAISIAVTLACLYLMFVVVLGIPITFGIFSG